MKLENAIEFVVNIKNELRKYIKRERAKKGKEESKLFWRTECRFGKSADSAQSVEFETLIKQRVRISINSSEVRDFSKID
jgi:hypothetical protein